MYRFQKPKCTMAEWNEAYADYEVMLQPTEEMLAGMVRELFGATTLERHGATLAFERPFARRDFATLVRETAGGGLGRAGEGALRAARQRQDVPQGGQLPALELFEQVVHDRLQPTLR